nr:immunoglobulin heavy chain junction region [Mus musculus]
CARTYYYGSSSFDVW